MDIVEGEICEKILMLGHKEQWKFLEQLKGIWRRRQNEHTGPHAYCDCMFYRGGDYLDALEQSGVEL